MRGGEEDQATEGDISVAPCRGVKMLSGPLQGNSADVTLRSRLPVRKHSVCWMRSPGRVSSRAAAARPTLTWDGAAKSL